MIHIVAYKSQNDLVTYLFDQDDGFLYRGVNGKKEIMGRPENFVFPHVPQPQDMKTYPARAVTLFCKEWLSQNKVN